MTQSTIQEIEQRITNLKESIERKKTYLEQYREKRAELVINEPGTTKNKAKVTSIDSEIKQLKRAIENAPAELALLEENLAAEQRRIAEKKRSELIEQQQEVANEIELLSKGFVSLLEKANNINTLLRAALTAEHGLREQTGQQILENYCHGSMQSLSMLLGTMQAQLNGQHTQLVGAGIVASAVPIRL